MSATKLVGDRMNHPLPLPVGWVRKEEIEKVDLSPCLYNLARRRAIATGRISVEDYIRRLIEKDVFENGGPS
jgi:hypothetical protein